MTCINLKQKIDIMEAKAVAKHQLSSQFVLEIHSLVLPQVRMPLITKNNKYLKASHRVKHPYGSYQNCLHKSGKIFPILTKLSNYNKTKTPKYLLNYPTCPMQFEFTWNRSEIDKLERCFITKMIENLIL